MMENRLEIATSLEARAESLSNLIANMVVIAAIGALADIIVEVSKVPRMPQT